MLTTQKYRLILVFLLIWLALACCDKNTTTVQEDQTFTPIVLMGQSPIPKLTLSPAPTKVSPLPSTTLTISPTLYPTITISPTIFATITDTPVPKPTLTDQQKSNLFVKLLQSYDGCSLPCWWGVIPGSTSVEKARQSLELLGFVNPNENGVSTFLVGEYDRIHVNVFLEQNNGVIELIDIRSQQYFDSTSFKKLWKRYSPELIIATYGKPTRIWLGLWPEVPPGGPLRRYELLFFYDDERILLFYVGYTNFEYGYMCPSFADKGNLFDEFGMWLSPSENKAPLENLPGAWIGSMPEYYPIEDVSGMSVDEFYNRMLKLKEDFCFKVSADKWP